MFRGFSLRLQLFHPRFKTPHPSFDSDSPDPNDTSENPSQLLPNRFPLIQYALEIIASLFEDGWATDILFADVFGCRDSSSHDEIGYIAQFQKSVLSLDVLFLSPNFENFVHMFCLLQNLREGCQGHDIARESLATFKTFEQLMIRLLSLGSRNLGC